ncbi:MAG: RNA-binding domain-containing protein [Thermoplasmata archaeon]
MVEIRLTAKCFSTEDRDKVVGAITKLFPDAEITGDDPIVARSTSIDAFGELLKRYRIRDAARGVMRRGLRRGSISFMLNKQVAAVGKVSFSEENHPLGDLEVTIVSDDINGLIDSIAPNTRCDGMERHK